MTQRRNPLKDLPGLGRSEQCPAPARRPVDRPRRQRPMRYGWRRHDAGLSVDVLAVIGPARAALQPGGDGYRGGQPPPDPRRPPRRLCNWRAQRRGSRSSLRTSAIIATANVVVDRSTSSRTRDTLREVRCHIDGKAPMTKATVTSKGQITIPANVRSDLKVGPGDRVEFVKIAEGHWEVLAAVEDVSRLRGMITPKRAVSIEEMNLAIRGKAGR